MYKCIISFVDKANNKLYHYGDLIDIDEYWNLALVDKMKFTMAAESTSTPTVDVPIWNNDEVAKVLPE